MLKNLIILWFSAMPFLAFAQDMDQDATVIRSSRIASNEALAYHDINGMAKYWLPDFVQTIGRGTSLTGKDTIIASWRQLFTTNPSVQYIRTPVTITVGDNGVMAWETGTWIAQNSYSKGGNYSAMWRKIDGEWKLQAELFVSLRKL